MDDYKKIEAKHYNAEAKKESSSQITLSDSLMKHAHNYFEKTVKLFLLSYNIVLRF